MAAVSKMRRDQISETVVTITLHCNKDKVGGMLNEVTETGERLFPAVQIIVFTGVEQEICRQCAREDEGTGK